MVLNIGFDQICQICQYRNIEVGRAVVTIWLEGLLCSGLLQFIMETGAAVKNRIEYEDDYVVFRNDLLFMHLKNSRF